MTLTPGSILIVVIMSGKHQVIFDIKSEKFLYLHRGKNKVKDVVDIDVLNQRLNLIKKSNLYSNARMIVYALVVAVFSILVSVYF